MYGVELILRLIKSPVKNAVDGLYLIIYLIDIVLLVLFNFDFWVCHRKTSIENINKVSYSTEHLSMFCAAAYFVDIFYRCSVLWLTLWTFSIGVLFSGSLCGHFL